MNILKMDILWLYNMDNKDKNIVKKWWIIDVDLENGLVLLIKVIIFNVYKCGFVVYEFI